MKKLLFLFALLFPVGALAQYAPIQNFCVQGAMQALTSGSKSSNNLQGVIPYCTVTVYDTGTLTLATIYSNGSGGTLTNPFQANQNGSWIFYVGLNQGYDIVLSGGYPPNTYTTPLTLTDVSAGYSSNIVGCTSPASGSLTCTGQILAAELGPVFLATQFAGGDPGAQVLAATNAAIAAGGGTIDARGLCNNGAETFTTEFDAGSAASEAANIGLEYIMPVGCTWYASGFTGGTNCLIRQFGSTTITGDAVGGGGGRLALESAPGSSSLDMSALYCLGYGSDGSHYYRASGFILGDNNGGMFRNGLFFIGSDGFGNIPFDQSDWSYISSTPALGNDAAHISAACCGSAFHHMYFSTGYTSSTGNANPLRIGDAYPINNVSLTNGTCTLTGLEANMTPADVGANVSLLATVSGSPALNTGTTTISSWNSRTSVTLSQCPIGTGVAKLLIFGTTSGNDLLANVEFDDVTANGNMTGGYNVTVDGSNAYNLDLHHFYMEANTGTNDTFVFLGSATDSTRMQDMSCSDGNNTSKFCVENRAASALYETVRTSAGIIDDFNGRNIPPDVGTPPYSMVSFYPTSQNINYYAGSLTTPLVTLQLRNYSDHGCALQNIGSPGTGNTFDCLYGTGDFQGPSVNVAFGNFASVSTPVAPTVSAVGTGASSYTYAVIAVINHGSSCSNSSNGIPHTALGSYSIAVTNGTLGSGGNQNNIFLPNQNYVSGYDVYRSVGGSNQGAVACNYPPGGEVADNGLTANGETPSTVNTTGTGQANQFTAGTVIPLGGIDIGANALTEEIPNNAGGSGAVLYSLLCGANVGGTWKVSPCTTSSAAWTGIAVGGALTTVTGNTLSARSGVALCTFDGTTTIGDYIQISTTTGGYCHDTGSSTYPTSGTVIGRVLTVNSGAATTASVNLFDPGINASVSSSGVTSFTGDGTFSNNSGSTGVVTLSLANASAHKFWGNNTGSSAAPGYETIGTGDLPGSGAITIAGTSVALGGSTTSFPSPGVIGGTTPAAIKGTTITATTSLTINGGTAQTGTQGTDTNLLTAGTISGTGVTLCTDSNAGATTSGCGITPVQLAMPTSLIGANSCTSPATVTMTGLVAPSGSTPGTTFTSSFESDPSAVSGWGSTGGFVLNLWATANTLHWEVCNQTTSGITGGAINVDVGAK
jgi:hypothetical protein